MASTPEYLEYVLDLLQGLDDITHRKMMGEYVLYYCGKVFGGIYDDRFLVKPTNSVTEHLPDAPDAIPYEGAKPMKLIDTEDRDLLAEMISGMYAELPESKKRKTKA